MAIFLGNDDWILGNAFLLLFCDGDRDGKVCEMASGKSNSDGDGDLFDLSYSQYVLEVSGHDSDSESALFALLFWFGPGLSFCSIS